MTTDQKKIQYVRTWAENAVPIVEAIGKLDELDAWIIENRYYLADAERMAPDAWAPLNAALRAQDGKIRETLRQGIGA